MRKHVQQKKSESTYSKTRSETLIIIASPSPLRDTIFIEEVVSWINISNEFESMRPVVKRTYRFRLSLFLKIFEITPRRAKRSCISLSFGFLSGLEEDLRISLLVLRRDLTLLTEAACSSSGRPLQSRSWLPWIVHLATSRNLFPYPLRPPRHSRGQRFRDPPATKRCLVWSIPEKP